MMSLPRNLDSVTDVDIASLIRGQVSESKSIEYKEQVPGGADSDKKEFLADVASFANCEGGDIIYGVVDKRVAGKPTGMPEEAVGLQTSNLQQEIARLEQIVHAGIEPRLHVQFKTVDGYERGSLLIIRIPRGANKPYMVTHSDSRFFSRRATGKFSLEIEEIRNSFLVSQGQRSDIERFRAERIARLQSGLSPVPLLSEHLVVLHVIPVQSLAPNSSTIDISRLKNDTINNRPFGRGGVGSGWNQRFNYDGVISYAPTPEGACVTYSQFFRGGAIEAVDAHLLHSEGQEALIIPSRALEDDVISTVERAKSLAADYDIELPAIIYLSLINVSGYRMALGSRMGSFDSSSSIREETLLLPDVILDANDEPVDHLLRPLFDILWQASGVRGSPNYDSAGIRLPPT